MDGDPLLPPDTSRKVRSELIVSLDSSSSVSIRSVADHLLRLTRVGRVIERELEGSVDMVGSTRLWNCGLMIGMLNVVPLKDSLKFSVGSSNAKELSDGANCSDRGAAG
eukprot:sb/3477442/